jgi:hypothetical protein
VAASQAWKGHESHFRQAGRHIGNFGPFNGANRGNERPGVDQQPQPGDQPKEHSKETKTTAKPEEKREFKKTPYLS